MLPLAMESLAELLGSAYRLERELIPVGASNRYFARDLDRQADVDIHVVVVDAMDGVDGEGLVEALRGLTSLSHANLAPVYAVGRGRGLVWWVTPHLAGVTVRDKIEAHGPAPAASCVRILLGVADGLAYATQEGVAHGGLVPEVIFFQGETVVVADVGVAGAMGTAVSEEEDVRAIGAVAYEILTGAAPRGSDPPPPRGPEIPDQLSELVMRCLASDPTSRVRSAAEISAFIRGREALSTLGAEGLPASGPLPGRIGPYQVRGILGRGGMGVVYLAEQMEPIRRRVAIKVVKPGMDSGEVLARFQAERQALAVLDHPGIATVYDAGTTESDRPYFAMEVVLGASLTAYCDEQRASMKERLDLFIQVCEAVQHAHARGILHRDLKPSNVLVTAQSGRPQVKVIDFGLAKALETPLTEAQPETRLGQVIGTPEYMSPEQAQADQLDTRTDVYSLGVILYELLVGVLPFEFAETARTPSAVHDVIRKSDPLTPSRRFDSLGDTRRDIAARRRTEPRGLTRVVRGDLDWIAMKALERDRRRRYQTVNALVEDVGRHLRHEPVQARPPSATYQLGRWVGRHPTLATSFAVGLVTLVVGLVVSTTLMVRATRAERVAEDEAEAAVQMSNFLVSLLFSADPTQGGGDTLTVKAVLERAYDQLGEEFADRPEVRARVLATMGDAYAGRGQAEEAIRLQSEAVALIEELRDRDDPELAVLLRGLGITYLQSGDSKAAQPLLERALAIEEQALGPDHREVGYTLIRLAELYFGRGRYEEALEAARRALDIREAEFGPDHERITGPLLMIVQILQAQGRIDEAVEPLERASAIREATYPPDDPSLYATQQLLADLLILQDRHGEAEAILRKTIANEEGLLGPDHYFVAFTLDQLGVSLTGQEKWDQAGAAFQRALEILDTTFGARNDYSVLVRQNVWKYHRARGAHAEAEAVITELRDHYAAREGAEHPDVARMMGALGWTYAGEGRLADADAAFSQALALMESHEATDPANLDILEWRASSLADAGLLERADSVYVQLLTLTEQAFGPTYERSRAWADRLEAHAGVLRRLGRTEEAEELERRMAQIGR